MTPATQGPAPSVAWLRLYRAAASLADCLCVLLRFILFFTLCFCFFPLSSSFVPFHFSSHLIFVLHTAVSSSLGHLLHGIHGYGSRLLSTGGVRSSWSVGSVAVHRILVSRCTAPSYLFFSGLRYAFFLFGFSLFQLAWDGGATTV